MAGQTQQGISKTRVSKLPGQAGLPATTAVKLRLKGPLPAKSIATAKSAFKNFSLSKFAPDQVPQNHVPAGQTAIAVQKEVISRNIDNLAAGTSQRALTLVLPEAVMKQMLPSLDQTTGTIDPEQLIGVIEKYTRGTEFYVNGNPTLNTLTIQTKVQQLIDSVKGGIKK